MSKKWIDVETQETVTEEQLFYEYMQRKATDEELKDINFEQYVSNCSTLNNGTLVRIAPCETCTDKGRCERGDCPELNAEQQ